MEVEYEVKYPIGDRVDLSEFGYPEGSEAQIVINPPKKFSTAWNDTFEQSGDPDYDAEQARYEMVPVIVTQVTLVDEQGTRHDYPIRTAEDARRLDQEVDGLVLDAVITEVWRRGRERQLDGYRSFPHSRRRDAEGAAPAGPARTGAGGRRVGAARKKP